jgi:hypothetical protein
MARDTGSESNVKPGWLSHVNEKVSLIALGMGVGIGFGGVVAMFIAGTEQGVGYWVCLPTTHKDHFMDSIDSLHSSITLLIHIIIGYPCCSCSFRQCVSKK